MDSSLLPPEVSPRVAPREWFALAFFLGLGGWLRLWQPDLAYFNLHTARDLYRTLMMLRGVEFPLLGSELQYGGRVLGPVMYLLCAIPLSVRPDPIAVAIFIGLINTGLIALVWWFARSYFGPAVAFWTAAFYTVFPLEIVQLRYLWNPCFLPLMTTLATIGLLQICVRRRGIHLLTTVFFLSMALQLHFSAVELILGCIAILILARWRVGARVERPVWLGALLILLILFAPFILSELTASKSNLADVITSPDTQRGRLERFSFNPNGFLSFLFHIHMNMEEETKSLGFVYLQSMRYFASEWFDMKTVLLLHFINAFSKVQLVFWAAGFGWCLRRAAPLWPRRGESREEAAVAERRERCRAAIPYLVVAFWQIIPVAFLSFFNFHGKPGDPPSLSPIRYYLISYPMPFITSGIGVTLLARWLRAASARLARRFGEAAMPRVHFGHLVWLLGGLLLAGHLYFSVRFIQLYERSGRSMVYTYPNEAPTLRTMLEIRDVLLDEARVDADAFYERVHHLILSNVFLGEATFDFLITQDIRSVTNPPSDPRLRWLIHAPYAKRDVIIAYRPWPWIRARARRIWRVGPAKDFTIIEYIEPNPGNPIPDAPPHKDMRNYYFREERMRYLGTELP